MMFTLTSYLLMNVKSKSNICNLNYPSQVGLQNELIREWFETTETSSGVLCAVQRVSSLHILTQRLINGWLLKYKRTNTT